jgi:type III pantothenate kinase
VRPQANEAVAEAWEEVTGGEVEFFGRDLPIPLPTALARPEMVGPDRLLLALGARARLGAPCIIVSAGTAVTIDLVDAEGAFAGGVIAPGLLVAARALHQAAAQLPDVTVSARPDALGRDTEGAIRSGVYWSCLGGVLAVSERLRAEPGCGQATLVCTGTDAPLLLQGMPEQARHAPDLIFEGMAAALGGAG